MFVRRTAVALAPRACQDVRAILLYMSEQWGAAQREAYLLEIDRALATLGLNPRLGLSRDDLAAGLHAFRVEQHVIYYRSAADRVTVLRILPWRLDPAQCFADSRN
jgi:plasmid stabilization system protein ParE